MRGVLHDKVCACCFESVVGCLKVWEKVFSWMNIGEVRNEVCLENFQKFMSGLRKKVKSSKVSVIWMAVVWSLWSRRNDIMFNNLISYIDDILSNIKFIFWYWIVIGANHRASYCFNDWCKNLYDFIIL